MKNLPQGAACIGLFGLYMGVGFAKPNSELASFCSGVIPMIWLVDYFVMLRENERLRRENDRLSQQILDRDENAILSLAAMNQ